MCIVYEFQSSFHDLESQHQKIDKVIPSRLGCNKPCRICSFDELFSSPYPREHKIPAIILCRKEAEDNISYNSTSF